MGAVFLAEQDRPVRRRVALKVIKAGMDSAQVVARFEAERQALALMDHPNIARVLDAGTTDSGRPFFVMELVRGVPITDFCDQARLSPRQRLELFIPVCQAIQHAHQKGVIHRDVKPSNVLVALVDGRPVPKVIDFGIAKAVDQRLTERSLFTQLGSIVGTLEYMSPEQADLSAQDVDTRTDVYALGVLLYELLTGTTPLERQRLREGGYAEILRRIKEEEPPRPSTRLSGSGDRLASIAAVRGVEPARLSRAMRGDLDWIVMKALEKSRSRRYETASGFARDVQRYLDGDEVEACPPSAGYRLRKLFGKHRAAIATASAFAGLLIAGAGISTAMAVRATRAERAARRSAEGARAESDRATAAERVTALERDRAVVAEGWAKAEADKSRRSAEESRAVLRFFQEQVLAAARPEGQDGGLGREVTIRRAVDAAVPKISRAFRDQPTVEAAVRGAVGRTYYYLGESAMAIRELERAAKLFETRLGPDHPDTLACRNELASAYLAAGRTADAIALHQANLETTEAELGTDHPGTFTIRNNLAEAYLAAGRTAEAIALHRANLEAMEAKLGTDDPLTLTGRNNLANAYRDAGRVAEAIPLFEATLEAREAKLGTDHPDTLQSRNNLATAYRSAGRAAEAIPLLEATIKTKETKLGTDHPDTLTSRNNLGVAYRAAGRTADAIALHQANLKTTEAKLGPDHPDTLRSRNNLALSYQAAGRTAEAIPLFEATLKAMEAQLGPDHPHTFATRDNLAAAYRDAGRTAEAIPLFEATLKAVEAKLGTDHPDTLAAVHNLAHALDVSRPLAAEPLFRRALDGYRKRQGPDGALTADLTRNLVAVLERTGRTAEAEPLLRDALERAREQFGPADPRTAGAMATLGLSLVQQGKWAAAEPVLRECLAVREKAQPDDWTTSNTRSVLGASLLGQKRYAEAEPLIVGGYEGLKAREARIPPPARSRPGRGRRAGDHAVRVVGQAGEGRRVAGPARAGRDDRPTRNAVSGVSRRAPRLTAGAVAAAARAAPE